MTLILDVDSRKKLRSQLAHDEDYRQFPYEDTRGILTIGYGRNLDSEGLSQDEALILMDNDIQRCEHELWNLLTNYANLGDVRKSVLINMAYNIGVSGVLKFHDMINALKIYDFNAASRAMINSSWYNQVGKRAERLAQMMATGEWINV